MEAAERTVLVQSFNGKFTGEELSTMHTFVKQLRLSDLMSVYVFSYLLIWYQYVLGGLVLAAQIL